MTLSRRQAIGAAIAMQVAAMAPAYLDEDDMPADEARKPEEVCLLHQAFIRYDITP